jgi:hypothetical protein
MSLAERLQAAILQGDVSACRSLSQAASEDERAAAGPAMVKTFDLCDGLVFSRDPQKSAKKLGVELNHDREFDILEASRVALLYTMTRVDALEKYVRRSIPSDDADVVAALTLRPRAIVSAWVEQMCEHAPDRWKAVRRVVRAGLCDRPSSNGYVLGMVHTVGNRFSRQREDESRALFDDDPQLLDEEVWRIFEVEGNRDISLTTHERVWQKLLVEYVTSGRLDRARMLDATLSALARDFAQHKAGFYSRLHDALKPSPQESASRAGTYVELLASRISPTVALATRVLSSMPAGATLDTASFARAATLAARSTRGQSTALVLLRLLHERRGDAEVLDAVATFLEHAAVEVVDVAIGALEASTPSRELVARVAELVPTIAASRRARVSAWVASHGLEVGEEPSPTTPDTGTTETPDAAPRDAERAGVATLEKAPAEGPWPRVTLDDPLNPAPRLDPSRRVRPIESLDELFAAAARAIEEPNDGITYERVLDGVSRLGAPLSALPLEARKPLAKRTTTIAARRSHPAVTLVLGWLEGDDGSSIASRYVNAQTFGQRRVKNVLKRIAKGRTRPLLSMPTTEGFFLDPRTFAARVKTQTGPVDVADTVTALLRLAPEGRGEALRELHGMEGELAAVVRRALGSDEDAPNTNQAALLSVAAYVRGGESARIRLRWGTERYEKTWATLEVELAPTPPRAIPADDFPALLATDAVGVNLGDEASIRELGSYCPSSRRSLLAHGAAAIARKVSWSDAVWENHVFIEMLLDPDVPLDDVGLLLLAVALNAKESRENTLATDSLVAAISDGRIVGWELGPVMAFYWAPVHDEVRWSQRPTANRWAKTLATVAQTSPLHAEVARRILESFFGAPPAAPPADVGTLLQLWLDLAVDARVAVPNRDVLKRYTGKAKKIASQLLALEGGTSTLAAEAHALAIAGRRARASRWTAWQH